MIYVDGTIREEEKQTLHNFGDIPYDRNCSASVPVLTERSGSNTGTTGTILNVIFIKTIGNKPEEKLENNSKMPKNQDKIIKTIKKSLVFSSFLRFIKTISSLKPSKLRKFRNVLR